MRFSRPRSQTVLLAAVVVVPSGVALGWVVTHGGEVATTVLSIPILLIGAATLAVVLPRPAQLEVVRLDELRLNDLIFYVEEVRNASGVTELPRDVLLQLTVAVANTGGRKAVLSGARLDSFVTADGREARPPGMPLPVAAMQWKQVIGYIDGRSYHSNLAEVGPWMLEPDDVIAIRFRSRRGINWDSAWTLDELGDAGMLLTHSITGVGGHLVWRQGTELVETPFEFAIEVAQQERYAAALRAITAEFTVRPDVMERPFPQE